MSATNDQRGTTTGTGYLIQAGLGVDLSIVSNAVAITNSVHAVTGSGSLRTISWAASNAPTNPSVLYLIRPAGSTWTFGSGGNVNVPSTATLYSNSATCLVWDGSASWYAATTSASSAYLNVKDFGAIGDGVADDTAAFRAAIAACVALGGGVIFVPAGVYLISSTLNLTVSKSIAFVGAGMGATIVQSGIIGNTPLWTADGPAFLSRMRWEALSCRGVDPGQFVLHQSCFVLAGMVGTRIRDCEVSAFGQDAISGQGCSDLGIETCYLHDNYNEGVLLNGGDTPVVPGPVSWVRGSYITNCPSYGLDSNQVGVHYIDNWLVNTGGLWLESVPDQQPHKNIIRGNNVIGGVNSVVGISLLSSGGTINDCIIEGNTVDSNGHTPTNITIQGQAGHVLSSIIVSGNTLRGGGAGFADVYVDHADNVMVTGNNMLSNGDYAIHATANVTNSTFYPNNTSKPVLIVNSQWPAYTPTLGASTGTFTGTIAKAQSRLQETTLDLEITVTGGSVSGTPSYLSVTMPSGFAARSLTGDVFSYSDNGTAGQGWFQIPASGSTILLYKNINGTGTWAASSGTTVVSFRVRCEV